MLLVVNEQPFLEAAVVAAGTDVAIQLLTSGDSY